MSHENKIISKKLQTNHQKFNASPKRSQHPPTEHPQQTTSKIKRASQKPDLGTGHECGASLAYSIEASPSTRAVPGYPGTASAHSARRNAARDGCALLPTPPLPPRLRHAPRAGHSLSRVSTNKWRRRGDRGHVRRRPPVLARERKHCDALPFCGPGGPQLDPGGRGQAGPGYWPRRLTG